MRNRWTIKELNEIDDFTFCMCLLSERRERLHQNAPLAQKIHSAYHTLGELRDICRENPDVAARLITPKEAIYWKVQHDYLLEDIKTHLSAESYNAVDCLENHGLTAEVVFSDSGMMSRIVELFHKHDGESDYWTILDRAIVQGIEDVLETRKEA